jgi:threonylcarbamoyladenosine tRNA methylthiotransferase MtaB
VPGVRRLRFGSLEPGIMTEEFVKALADIPETCPQFHLSLQSGCDATLARMNRRYDTASYAAICDRLRTAFARPAITTDIIVGFPGETDEEFGETLAFARKIGFSKMHIFKYSKRDGTKAASMKNQVSEQVKKRRSEALLELDREMHRSYASLFRGAETEVLFEERKTENGVSYETGHTPEALDAYCISGEELSGRIVRCKVRDIRDDGTLLCGDIFPA